MKSVCDFYKIKFLQLYNRNFQIFSTRIRQTVEKKINWNMKYVYNILKNVMKLISRKNPPKNNENIHEIEITKNFVKLISQKKSKK